MMSGPPNAESDSDFNRNSSMMVRNEKDNNKKSRRRKQTGQDGKKSKLRGTQEMTGVGQGHAYASQS